MAAARRLRPLEELGTGDLRPSSPRLPRGAGQARPDPLIAEVKKASPRHRSSGPILTRSLSPRTYQEHGASCLSVLTDAPYFQGRLAYLTRIRAAVAIPLLRKDFLIDDYQVVEARAAGADAVLLIAEILDDATLAGCLNWHEAWEWPPWSSSTIAANLPRVLASGADLIGINNRDLRHFDTDVEHTLRLRDQIPPEVILVSESGIRTRRDVERLEAAGVAAILVGESLMRAPDIGLAVERLLGLAPEADTVRATLPKQVLYRASREGCDSAAWPCRPASGSAHKRPAPSPGRR